MQAKGSELQAGCGSGEDKGPAGTWTAACTEGGGEGRGLRGPSAGAARRGLRPGLAFRVLPGGPEAPGDQLPAVSPLCPAVACEPGTHFSGESGRCVLCAPGTYQDVEGQLSCSPCPSNDGHGLAGARNVSECGGKCGPSQERGWGGDGAPAVAISAPRAQAQPCGFESSVPVAELC